MTTYYGDNYRAIGAPITLAELSAVGASDSIQVIGCKRTTVNCTVASIGTTVVLQMEGVIGSGSNWAILGSKLTINANGVYSFNVPVATGVTAIRMYLVSITDGSPTVNFEAFCT